jgi:hypothetical protein
VKSTCTYAVSYLHGRDEAWVARFLDDLNTRLAALPGATFVRWTARTPGPASPGVATADLVLALCSPAYFTEGPADADWAVLAHRTSLERARGRSPRIVLPLLWEPMAQRLPDVVAEADGFTARQPPEYRSLGLALLTMQAARHRAVLDEVLADLTRWFAESRATAPELPGGTDPAPSVGELPRALAADDARFTALFRARAHIPGPAGEPEPLPRRLRRRAGSGQRTEDSAALAAAGRRLLLVGPAGSGRSVELRALARRVMRAGGGAPWDCRTAFLLPAHSGALPPLDGLVPVVAPALTAQEPAGWAARQLHEGRALLAVDGLDRAPAHRRTAAWEWLLRTAAAHPQAPIVVETNGTSVPWHRLEGVFAPVFLEPLTAAARARLLGPQAPVAKAPPDSAAVDGAAAEGPSPDAAGPPGGSLLESATIWPAAVEAVRRHGSRGQLDLLRAAVTAAWRQEDEEDLPVRSRVRDSVLRAAAGGLAVATLPDGGAPLPVGRALAVLEALHVGGSAGPVTADRLLAALADRAGLLYAPAPGTVAFSHEAARVLLAAEHLAARPGPETERALAVHAGLTGTDRLARLVAELSVPRRSAGRLPGLLEHGVNGGQGRRLTARPVPAAVRDAPRVVRTSDALWRLAGQESVTEVHCHGPLDGLETALAALPGLRALVIADHPGLTAVPDLARLTALRSLRLINCPALRDVRTVARSALTFLTVDPWRENFDLAPLAAAPWLRRVDLITPGAVPGGGTFTEQLARVEVRVHTHDDHPPADTRSQRA